MPDVDVYEINGVPGRCPGCRLELFGSRVSIRGGVIRAVDAIPKGAQDENVLAVEIDPQNGAALRTFDIFIRTGVMPAPG